MIMKHGMVMIVLFCTTVLSGTAVVVVGCGYVGLTFAAVLAGVDHTITCVDIDGHKIQSLKNYQLPLYEPGLHELLFDGAKKNRITFTNSFDDIEHAHIYYVCVPTPVDAQGACDCSYVRSACAAIIAARSTDEPIIVVVKSTVVPGTLRSLHEEFSTPTTNIHFVYNPEFMREGCALQDIRTRNPIVLGAESDHALHLVEQLLTACLPAPTDIIKTNFETAELIKYSWNTFSALRIAYVNELATTCRLLGADIVPVVQGLALSEQLLPTAQLKPGPGYGGSCLPKDTIAFAHMLDCIGLNHTMSHHTIESNQQHKNRLVRDIVSGLELVRGSRTVTLLGLSFKAHTNDIRNSVALDIIPALQARGVTVRVYDPVAMPTMQAVFHDVIYCTSAYEAAEDSDCIVILTEWPEFSTLDLAVLGSVCRKKRIIDTRNLFSPTNLYNHGFDFITMGTL